LIGLVISASSGDAAAITGQNNDNLVASVVREVLTAVLLPIVFWLTPALLTRMEWNSCPTLQRPFPKRRKTDYRSDLQEVE